MSSLSPNVTFTLYWCHHGLIQRLVGAPIVAKLLRAPTRCTAFAVSSTFSTDSSLAHLLTPGVLGCPEISYSSM